MPRGTTLVAAPPCECALQLAMQRVQLGENIAIFRPSVGKDP